MWHGKKEDSVLFWLAGRPFGQAPTDCNVSARKETKISHNRLVTNGITNEISNKIVLYSEASKHDITYSITV